ncbi:IS3 family transposase [Garciella nitratireducens]|uniref:IS3 family transposase n=1 Tax=Garciella nitratireducens TaxID=218205 RepID=UPI003B5AA2B2
MCKVLKFPRSTYYKVLNHVPSNRQKESEQLKRDIRAIYTESKGRYGAPKIQEALKSKRL